MSLDNDLCAAAKSARDNAYAPYSKFHVGASILLQNQQILIGANIENASYGLAMCAERNVLFNAYSQGWRQANIVKMAIISNNDTIVPCGACLQVMSELLLSDTALLFLNSNGKVYATYNVKDLLPYGFKIHTK